MHTQLLGTRNVGVSKSTDGCVTQWWIREFALLASSVTPNNLRRRLSCLSSSAQHHHRRRCCSLRTQQNRKPASCVARRKLRLRYANGLAVLWRSLTLNFAVQSTAPLFRHHTRRLIFSLYLKLANTEKIFTCGLGGIFVSKVAVLSYLHHCSFQKQLKSTESQL